MRRRPQRVQVSTFPFLAVLLCAMGSLILLLLVIDRRAKVVARAKALLIVTRAAQEEERIAERRRAEWERRRQELHEQLLQEDEQVRAQIHTLQAQAETTADSLRTEQREKQAAQDRLRAEQAQLDQWAENLSAQEHAQTQAEKLAAGSQSELSRLTAQLVQLERTLADLKAARQRQQHLYSFVPYRGKRGDRRRPIYIECNAGGLIFHPDRLPIHVLNGPPSDLRTEIERRLAATPVRPTQVGQNPSGAPYLLMLVRPDGIAAYYRTLAALQGLPVDFGYEFIGQDWILDFSEEKDLPKAQPWVVAENGTNTSKAIPPQQRETNKLSAVTGPKRSQGVVFGTGVPANAARELSPEVGAPLDSKTSTPVELGQVPSLRRANSSVPATDAGRTTAASTGAGHGPLAAQRAGVLSSSIPARIPNEETSAQRAGTPSSIPANEETSAQRAGTPSSIPARSASKAATLADAASSAPAPYGSAGPEINTAHRPTNAARETDDPSAVSVEASLATGPSSADSEGSPASTTPAKLPALVPARAEARPSTSVEAAASAAKGAPVTTPDEMPETASEPKKTASIDPLTRVTPASPELKTSRSARARAPLFGLSRDWIIAVECHADMLVLSPSDHRIAVTELSASGSGTNPLRETISQLIAKRQATVRPGETPYRPLIRFRVWPDGLRAYYLAYPILETLKVPMSRENVDPDEEGRR